MEVAVRNATDGAVANILIKHVHNSTKLVSFTGCHLGKLTMGLLQNPRFMPTVTRIRLSGCCGLWNCHPFSPVGILSNRPHLLELDVSHTGMTEDDLQELVKVMIRHPGLCRAGIAGNSIPSSYENGHLHETLSRLGEVLRKKRIDRFDTMVSCIGEMVGMGRDATAPLVRRMARMSSC